MEKRKLGLSTAVFMVMGTMIGSGIFIVSADISRVLGNPLLLLLVWIATGLLTLIAASCYSEFSGMFPQSGGQYQYLKEAYNPLLAFLYGWSLFLVIQSGAIAAVAVAFAKFSAVLFPFFSPENVLFNLGSLPINAAQLLAIFSIFIITLINTRGVHYGGLVQSILTVIKASTLLFVIVTAIFLFSNPESISLNFSDFFNLDKKEWINGQWNAQPWTITALLSAFGVAMVGSLFSSDAWNNVTFIANEIDSPKKNVPKALVFGVSGVVVLYLLANIAYLFVLPMWGNPAGTGILDKGIQYVQDDRVATGVMSIVFGPIGASIMAALIMISTFGANNGMMLSASRVYQTMAQDGLFFKNMAVLNKNHVPEISLWIQFVWCSLLCLSGKYGDLLDYVMFVVVLFYVLAIVGLFILRKKAPHLDRPIKAFGYPFLPIVYILAMSGFVVNLILQKPNYTIPGLAIVLCGIPVYYLWRAINGKAAQEG
jgi:basic amino acid/polyamine antiporter, APA family